MRKVCGERGVKQGDPLSPILFNAVLEKMFRTIKAKWVDSKTGIDFGHRRLANLRFADDILLIAPSLQKLKDMIRDLAHAGAPCG